MSVMDSGAYQNADSAVDLVIECVKHVYQKKEAFGIYLKLFHPRASLPSGKRRVTCEAAG